MANHSGPESCGGTREGVTEALAGETGRSGIEPRNQESGAPTLLSEAEGNTEQGANRKPCDGPARSKTLHMPGSLLHGSWEISIGPGEHSSGRTGKAICRNPVLETVEKSDSLIVPKKPSNKGTFPAEMVEGRSEAEGNAEQTPASRTLSRIVGASMGLERVREAARRNRRLRFTALLHHITPQLLVDSLYSLQRNAAAGVDGTTWRQYQEILAQRVPILHRLIHTGAYRARPSHCCGTDRKGRFRIIRLTAKKRMRATLAAIRDALYRKRHEPVPAVGTWLKRVMNGYFEYHAVPTADSRENDHRSPLIPISILL